MSRPKPDQLRAIVPGFVVCIALACFALVLEQLPLLRDTLHLGSLLIVILLGMALSSAVRSPETWEPGIGLAQKGVLRLAVAGLGLKLSGSTLVEVGAPSLLIVLAVTVLGLIAGYWIAVRLGIEQRLATLLGVGGAICGASAIVAADSVVQAEKSSVACGLGTITLLGTIGILAYPWIGHWLEMSPLLYGVWNGATIHEMAQVVAAGQGFGEPAVDPSTVVKLARICLLAPIVFGIGWLVRRSGQPTGEGRVPLLPWFLVAFVLLAIVNSLQLLPKSTIEALGTADKWLLCVGMAGVGLHSGWNDLKRAGAKPVIAGALQWVLMSAAAYALARALLR